MEIIDTKGCFNDEVWKDYLSLLTDNCVKYILLSNDEIIDQFGIGKKDLSDFIINQLPEESFELLTSIEFESTEIKFIIHTDDLLYWRANTRRKNKILKCQQEPKQKKINFLKIEVFDSTGEYSILCEEGTKKDVINKINEGLKLISLENITVMDLLISINDGEKIKFSDLIEQGILVLEKKK